MNVRRICLLILLVIIIPIVTFKTVTHKVVRVKSEDVLCELKLSAQRYGFKLQNVYLTNENILRGKIDNILIIFSREKSFDDQMRTLQKLIKSSTINSNTKQVDFRFSKIVVK